MFESHFRMQDWVGFDLLQLRIEFFWIVSIPANICLSEDVQKTSRRRLQCNIFLSFKTSWRHNCKTSGRRHGRRKVLRWRHLEDVLKTSWKTRNVCWDACLQNFIFLFMSFSTTPIIKNSNVLAGISFIFLKKRPRPKVKVFQYQSCTSVKWSEM